MCDHMVGIVNGVDESWVAYTSEGNKWEHWLWEEVFNYCPLCGEKLLDD